MFFTLDALITELEKMRAERGGSCQVGIEDADTNWVLPIERVNFDENENRVLIFGDYHGEEFPLQPTGES